MRSRSVALLLLVLLAGFAAVIQVQRLSRQSRWEEACGEGRVLTVKEGLQEQPFGEREVERESDGRAWRPWGDLGVSGCGRYETRFGRGLPRVPLLSFPCSGNTWLRYLLEGASGVFTGSEFADEELLRAGFLGEGEDPDSGRTLVQKSHGSVDKSGHDLVSRHDAVDPRAPAVLLLRDPRKAIISFWKLLSQPGDGRHTVQLSLKDFQSNAFRGHVERMTSLWEELATDRLLWNSAPLLVLHYERLVADPLGCLRELLRFLGVAVDEGRLRCVAAQLEGSFKRSGNEDFDPYTLEEKRRFSLAVERVQRLLKLTGHSDPPLYEWQSDLL
ncbi:WSC domain-containing protein 1-like [Penaeus japonicus]|uniref:WSC domain-containing protein 1-like n=1 Tax=Penaeus japonicus TaxID=27405 RepID=UPI001C710898|nr:WSC domain-containing protein 1-like [Penaeus japonicus]